MKNEDVTLVCPAYNNLEHLKNLYASFKRNCPGAKIMFADDGSTDGTADWIKNLPETDDQVDSVHFSPERVGHTILYDRMIAWADTPIVGIVHADMIIGPNYLENLLKHIERGKVVCATRVEPPLHPAGKEKIIKDFGLDYDELDIDGFEKYCYELQSRKEGLSTHGMFAPWIIYKEDFDKVDGHDDLFAPFPYEDSDIFQRWIQEGYELIQSRDSFVYHLTCRGHRWTKNIGEDDEFYGRARHHAAKNWFRKWGTWIDNDEYQCPIVHKMYDVAIILKECTRQHIEALEPHAGVLYCSCEFDDYIEIEQPNTKFDLEDRIKSITEFNKNVHDVNIYINGTRCLLSSKAFEIIRNVHQYIEIEHMEPNSKYRFFNGNMIIEINGLR